VKYLLACLLIVCCCSNPAAAQWQGESTSLAWQSNNSVGQSQASLLQRLRLQGDGVWQAWSWQMQYDLLAIGGGVVRDPLFALQKQQPPATYGRLQATLWDHSPWYVRHQLYRAWLQYQRQDWQITAGRQRIAWGSGRVWNPTDRFNPVLPTALEPTEKVGVDALNLRWNYSGFGSIQAVAAPGRTAYGIPRKLAMRWQDTWKLGDLSLLWLRVGKEDYAGLDYAGNFGDAGIRLEALRGMRNHQQQWIIGSDYTWLTTWLPNGLYIAAEYLHNARPQRGSLSTRSQQLLAINTAYDLNSLWRLDVTVIQDLEQPSNATIPQLTWSVIQDIEVQLTGQWFNGNKQGEFANANTLTSLRLRWYF
jgi:hypothetical protein